VTIAEGVLSENDDSEGGVEVPYRSSEFFRARGVSLTTRALDTGAEIARWITGGFLDDWGLLLAECGEVDGKEDAGDEDREDTAME
jgi:hypothetical protein